MTSVCLAIFEKSLRFEGGLQAVRRKDKTDVSGVARSKGTFRIWVGEHLPRKTNRFPKAYEGDTYVKDLNKSSKARAPWVSFFPLGVALACLADLYLLSDTMNMVIRDDLYILIFPVISVFVALALFGVCAFFSYIVGRRIREYTAFEKRTALASSIFLLVINIGVLITLFLVRLDGEVKKSGGYGSGLQQLSFGGSSEGTLSIGASSGGDGGILAFVGTIIEKATDMGPDVWINALVLSLIMLLAIILEAFYAYFSYDPFAGEKKKLAEAYAAEDRQLYERIFFERVSTPEKCKEYERRERELDKRVVTSAFKINRIATQLNGMVDPADAYDFCRISRLLDKDLVKD